MPKENQTPRLSFRLSEDELIELQQKADSAHLTMTHYIRKQLGLPVEIKKNTNKRYLNTNKFCS